MPYGKPIRMKEQIFKIKNVKKQVWMKKIEQLQIGELDQCREDGFHMEIQV